MTTEEEMHMNLQEHNPVEIDVFEDIVVNLKINLKDKTPPGSINFSYSRGKDLLVYVSKLCKDPNEENN